VAEANRYLAASPGDGLNLSADEIADVQGPGRRPQRLEAGGRSTGQAACYSDATRPTCNAASAGWRLTSVAAAALRAVRRAATSLRRGTPPRATRAAAAPPAALVSSGEAGGARRALLLASLRSRRAPELHATPPHGHAGGRQVCRGGPRVLREPRLQHVASVRWIPFRCRRER
jgi:hypothetical protein